MANSAEEIQVQLAHFKSERAKLWQIARTYKNTKWLDKGRSKSGGVDCMTMTILCVREYGLDLDPQQIISRDMTPVTLEQYLHPFFDKVHRWQAEPGDVVFWKTGGSTQQGILAPGDGGEGTFNIIYAKVNDKVIEEPFDTKRVALRGIYRLKWLSGAPF